ncbi:MAG: hypothetical protein JW726_18030 [Anaerolineales bacterium]|nr:hypothetical protein [Anaerolineales bacterium]
MSALGLDSGNCGPETPFPTWQCTLVDAGEAEVDEAEFVSLAFDLNGLAMIAYAEHDTIYDTYDLKIAYQRLTVLLPVVFK